MKKLICLLTFVSLFPQLYGQQAAYFLFGEKEFEGVDIYDVIQDFDENYWFATDQGLIMHDGYTFENIECEEMRGNSVFGFVIGKDGVIYCHNLNHQVFEIRNNKCTQIFEIPDKGVDISLTVTADNKLLVSSSREIYLVEKNTFTSLNVNLQANYITNTIELKNNTFLFHYVGTNKLIVWDNYRNIKRQVILKNDQIDWLKSTFKIFKYQGEIYFISVSSGDIYLLNESTFELQLQHKWNNKDNHRIYPLQNSIYVGNNIAGITIYKGDLKKEMTSFDAYSNYFISDVFVDKEGNTLLSTFDNGVLVIPDTEVLDVDERFSPFKVTKIHSANKQDIYFGTNNGQLLSYDGKKIQIINEKGLKKIETLYTWEDHSIVISDNSGFSATNLNTKQTRSYVNGSLKSILPISHNKLIGAFNFGLRFIHYDEKSNALTFDEPLLSCRAYNLCQEQTSKLIYASTSTGLYSITNEGHLKSLKLNDRDINALAMFSSNGKTYISTRKNGILVFRKGQLIDTFFPKINDTPLSIFKMIIDDHKIYANTQVGLIILDEKGKILKFVNRSSGLATNKIIDFAIHDQALWITHSRGIQRFSLNKINQKITTPNLILSDIYVNSNPIIDQLKVGQYTSSSRKFKFVFKVHTLNNRENIRYHFRLEGNNEDWHTQEYNNNEVVYNALAPGKYTFIVKAENNGIFSLPQSYSFIVSAPFYQRWWFNVAIGLLLLLLITLIYKKQLRIQKKKADQLNELNASRLTAIQSQMNPHFIFNSLNSIQDLVLKGDVDNSYTFITKFSNLVRRTLNYSDKDFIDFEEEIKLIELYLSLEKLRFKESLEYSIHTNDVDDIMIPPMLIQPFIENALVHGLLHKEGTKLLNINFTLTDVLTCEITDNGIGREKALKIKNRQRSNHESFAVNAIKRRFNILQTHFKGELGFEIQDIMNDQAVIGTKVILKIPIKNKY